MTKKLSGCIGRPYIGGEIWGPDLPLLNSCGAERVKKSNERWAGFKKIKWSVSGAEREVVGAGAERWAGLS